MPLKMAIAHSLCQELTQINAPTREDAEISANMICANYTDKITHCFNYTNKLTGIKMCQLIVFSDFSGLLSSNVSGQSIAIDPCPPSAARSLQDYLDYLHNDPKLAALMQTLADGYRIIEV